MRLDGGGERGSSVVGSGLLRLQVPLTFCTKGSGRTPPPPARMDIAIASPSHVFRLVPNRLAFGLGARLTIGFREFPCTTPGSFAWASGFCSRSAISRRVSSEDISIVISYPAAGGDNGIAYLEGQDTPRAPATVRPAARRNRLKPLQNPSEKDAYLDMCPKTRSRSPRGF